MADTENITLSLNKRTLTAFSLIVAGLLMLQAWWLGKGSVSADEIQIIIAAELDIIKKDQQAISERTDVIILNMITWDQRLKLIEESIGCVQTNKDGQKQTSAILSHLNSLHAEITRWRNDSTPRININHLPQLPPDNHVILPDTNHRNYIRRQRMNFVIPYVDFNPQP